MQGLDFTRIMRNLLSDLRVALADAFDKNFPRGGFMGQRWKPLADGTASHLISRGQAAGAHGALRRSIVSRVEGSAIVFRSDTPYAAVHNEGLRAGRGRGFIMPRRQFIGEYEGMDKTVERIAARVIEEEMKNLRI